MTNAKKQLPKENINTKTYILELGFNDIEKEFKAEDIHESLRDEMIDERAYKISSVRPDIFLDYICEKYGWKWENP